MSLLDPQAVAKAALAFHAAGNLCYQNVPTLEDMTDQQRDFSTAFYAAPDLYPGVRCAVGAGLDPIQLDAAQNGTGGYRIDTLITDAPHIFTVADPEHTDRIRLLQRMHDQLDTESPGTPREKGFLAYAKALAHNPNLTPEIEAAAHQFTYNDQNPRASRDLIHLCEEFAK